MEQKIVLQELCENLAKELNGIKETNQIRTVDFFSGLKPLEGKMVWFVEVGVDRKVIFRRSHIPRENEDLKIVEGFMITRVLRDIFTFGVMSSKKLIDERMP